MVSQSLVKHFVLYFQFRPGWHGMWFQWRANPSGCPHLAPLQRKWKLPGCYYISSARQTLLKIYSHLMFTFGLFTWIGKIGKEMNWRKKLKRSEIWDGSIGQSRERQTRLDMSNDLYLCLQALHAGLRLRLSPDSHGQYNMWKSVCNEPSIWSFGSSFYITSSTQ